MTKPIQKFRLESKSKPDNGNQFIGKLQAGGVHCPGCRKADICKSKCENVKKKNMTQKPI